MWCTTAPKFDHAAPSWTNAEYARGKEDRLQTTSRTSAGRIIEVKAPVQSRWEPYKTAAPAQVDTRRKKQARPDKKRDDFDEEDKQRIEEQTKWETRSTDNKKIKEHCNGPNQYRQIHDTRNRYRRNDIAGIANGLSEPAKSSSKLFMMEIWHKTNPWWYHWNFRIANWRRKASADADIERFFVEEGLTRWAGERPCHHHDTLTAEDKFSDTSPRGNRYENHRQLINVEMARLPSLIHQTRGLLGRGAWYSVTILPSGRRWRAMPDYRPSTAATTIAY